MHEFERQLTAIRRHFDAGVAELLKAADEAAEKAIKRRFGRGWFGGRFQWTHQLPGHGYELVLSGKVDITIPMTSDQAYVDVTFDANRPYSAVPILTEAVQNDPGGGHLEGDYQAWHTRLTATGFRLHIAHLPLSAANFPVAGGTTAHTGAMDSPPVATSGPTPNTSGDNNTYSTGMYSYPGLVPASTTPLPTGGVNGSPSTGDNSDGTETGDISSGTAGSAHKHYHNDSATHHHTHPEGAHDHETADHVHNLNNHSHDLANHTHNNGAHTHALTLDTLSVDVTPNETADRTLSVGWIAVGLQTPPA